MRYWTRNAPTYSDNGERLSSDKWQFDETFKSLENRLINDLAFFVNSPALARCGKDAPSSPRRAPAIRQKSETQIAQIAQISQISQITQIGTKSV